MHISVSESKHLNLRLWLCPGVMAGRKEAGRACGMCQEKPSFPLTACQQKCGTKGACAEASDKNMDVLPEWEGRSLCYKVQRAQLPVFFCLKVEPRGHRLGYMAQEIVKQSAEGTAWLLLAASSKLREKGDNWERSRKQKATRSWGLGKFQIYYSVAECSTWVGGTYNEQGNLYTRLTLGDCRANRSQHPPTRILKVTQRP